MSLDMKIKDRVSLKPFLNISRHALLERGAIPVVGGAGTQYDWIFQPQYGETKEEILQAVIKEWFDSGAIDCDPGGLWFALPSQFVGAGG